MKVRPPDECASTLPTELSSPNVDDNNSNNNNNNNNINNNNNNNTAFIKRTLSV